MDPTTERSLLGIAHALYINRLHLLRLTEVVRHGIRPDGEDGTMQLPAHLDREVQQQAIDFVLTCFPEEMAPLINQARKEWQRPA
ncbi:MAG TPA: hypothetical protein VK698_34515 [Kofleriaceae bacterium]|nr:hypothetical protein [Kofleriaceae bacterium]